MRCGSRTIWRESSRPQDAPAAREVPRYHLDVMSKTVAAAEFQAHPLELLEEVAANQEEVVILKDGKPLARVVPIEPGRLMTLEEFRLKYPVKILGEIVEPIDW